MRKFLAFIACLILIFIGCSSTTPLLIPVLSSNGEAIQTNVHIDYSFSPSEENDITNAIKSWECSLNYKIRFKIYYNAHHEDFYTADTKDLFIWKVDGKDQHIVEADKNLQQGDDRQDRFVVGLFLVGTEHASVILLRMDRIHTDLWQITTHELGHFLGAEHSDSKNSIMYRFTDLGAKDITKLDVQKICSIYKFNPNDMKVCNIK